jgi:hypothetical protein
MDGFEIVDRGLFESLSTTQQQQPVECAAQVSGGKHNPQHHQRSRSESNNSGEYVFSTF